MQDEKYTKSPPKSYIYLLFLTSDLKTIIFSYKICFFNANLQNLPASCALMGSLLWWAGRISSLTASEVLASSCVASIREQCSVPVPSIERRMSPTCSAPHLTMTHTETCSVRRDSIQWRASTNCLLHLSTTLAGFILSITITCLFLYMAVVRLMPRLAEEPFTISTSRGPEACCTASEGDNTHTL